MRNNNLKGILRIEHRQKTNVRKMLLPNSQRIMMVHLLYKKVQQNLIQLWLKNYYAINKNKTPRFPTNVKDFKEMKNILACKQIHIEGINKILADADEAATVNNWTPKKKSVTKKEIRNLYNTQFESTSPHYIMEIEEKVRTNVELLQWISTGT
ncbi:MAG: hypothetical protein IPF62_08040 [Bacteroidetes bacterium]|nr:hypothetical protein [Bacteroidota bacterium]